MVQRFGLPGFCYWKSDIASENVIMNSPLPDSGALEAGILEDKRPVRPCGVQNNVRQILRTSLSASVKSSPTLPTHPPIRTCRLSIPSTSSAEWQVEGGSNRPSTSGISVLPSPATQQPDASYNTRLSETPPAFSTSPASHQQGGQHVAHQSALFNTRAVAALDHPDLSNLSPEHISQQKAQYRQRTAWKRSRRSRKTARTLAGSRGTLCFLASLLMAALVATYVTIATTASGLTTTFHVLFVLGICLATIVFAHSVVRLFFIGRSSENRPQFIQVSRHGHGRRHRRRQHQHQQYSQRRPLQIRQLPFALGDPEAFVPPAPIAVHQSTDHVHLHPTLAQPAAATMASAQHWDNDIQSLPNPPPAYGRWRGSVRADPDLLHWQAIPSPRCPDMPTLPSPTYDEAIAATHNASPPSYMTREFPARQHPTQKVRAGIAQTQEAEPEMVEVRGVGIGAAV